LIPGREELGQDVNVGFDGAGEGQRASDIFFDLSELGAKLYYP
jgi:hypothetical protein